MLKAETAVINIEKYIDVIVKDPQGRYMSWCHCYNAFMHDRDNADLQTIDYLSLNLAFYLASWGMYRGSSFLLQKDYKVHMPVVKVITDSKYSCLCGISAEALQEPENLDLIDDITGRIRQIYAETGAENVTDTLVTKILLGTLGCVPAYDRYYIQSVKKYKISSGKFNRESVLSIAQYYIDNKEEFEKVRMKISSDTVSYPPMKLMDMCMWQTAYQDSAE